MSEPKLHFYFGGDDFTLSAAVQEKRADFLRKHPAGETVLLDFTGESVVTMMPQLIDALRSQSLFTAQKFVVLKNFFGAQKKKNIKRRADENKDTPADSETNPHAFTETLLTLLETSVNDEVFLWEREPDKRSAAYKTFSAWREAGKMEWREWEMPLKFAFNDWLTQRVRARGGTIGKAEVEYLAVLLGKGMEQKERGKTLVAYDLFAAASEVDKLVTYAAGESISRPMIDLLVASASDMNIFSLIEAIGRKDRARAFTVLSGQIEQGFHESYILAMLVYHFRALISARSLSEQGFTAEAIAAELKMNPWVTQKNLNYARAFTTAQLKVIYHKLAGADKAIKSGTMSAELAIDLLVAVV